MLRKAEMNGVAFLSNEIDLRNENWDPLMVRYSVKPLSVSRMLQEKDELHCAYCEETRRMQRIAQENVQRVLDEQEKLSSELESKKRKIENWGKELNKLESLTERDRHMLAEEKKKSDLRSNALQMTSEELRKSDKNVLRLVEQHKREEEEALKKILDLERDLNAKQKLQMEIEELKGKVRVMEYMGDDAAVQKQIQEMNEELNEKIEEMKSMESLYQTFDNQGTPKQ